MAMVRGERGSPHFEKFRSIGSPHWGGEQERIRQRDRHYDKSIRIDPGNAFGLYRGIAKRNKGDVAGARADIAAALQIDPEIAGKVGEMAVPLTPVTTNLPQSRSVPSCEALRDGGHPGAQVPSYVDAPIGVLKMMVPGLSGIRIDMVENASDGTPAMPTQDMTASILNRTGAVIADQFHRMPNLIAKEEVKEPKYTTLEYGSPAPSSLRPGGGSIWQGTPITEFRTRVYTYRIVHKQTPAGGDALDEFRTDAHDQPVDDSAHNPQRLSNVGFATTWLFFLPGNLQESHFRYVGMQKIGDRETYVLAFAQIPEQEGLRVVVESSYGSCSTPIQGVAWIDQSTFQIVRVQTDLLTPLPGIQLNQLRSKLNYGAAKIRERNLSLWLPSEVEITWQTALEPGTSFTRIPTTGCFNRLQESCPLMKTRRLRRRDNFQHSVSNSLNPAFPLHLPRIAAHLGAGRGDRDYSTLAFRESYRLTGHYRENGFCTDWRPSDRDVHF